MPATVNMTRSVMACCADAEDADSEEEGEEGSRCSTISRRLSAAIALVMWRRMVTQVASG